MSHFGARVAGPLASYWLIKKTSGSTAWDNEFDLRDGTATDPYKLRVLIPFDEGEDEAAARDLADRIARLLNGGS